jgi:DsbE subfamily thiol:disulfide oxidoreductase
MKIDMKILVKIIPFLIAIIFTVALIYKVYSNQENDKNFDQFSKNSVGQEVTDMEINLLAFDKKEILEDQLTRNDYLNKITIINLFASWCIACLAEHGHFSYIKDKFGDKIQLVGINWRDKKDDVLIWLEKNGNPYNKIGFDNLGKYGIALGVRGIPETLIVDEKGMIIDHYRGNIDNAYVERLNGFVNKGN